MARPGALRWAVDTTRWAPGPAEWDFLLSLVPEEDAAAVEKFRFEEDRKHALASRLLQRAAAAAALGLPHQGVVIRRTKGNKPYVASAPPAKGHAPNFNFSVSHEGDYVVLASEPLCLCGCDVAAPGQARRRTKQEPFLETLGSFRDQLTSREWQSIVQHSPDEAAMEARFRQLWSLKEAYVKAVGLGLAFDLGSLEFDVRGATATVTVAGARQEQWAFHLHELGRGHWVSVARAPPSAVVDAWGGFVATFERPALAKHEVAAELRRPEPAFQLLAVADLVPEPLRPAYEAAGGELL